MEHSRLRFGDNYWTVESLSRDQPTTFPRSILFHKLDIIDPSIYIHDSKIKICYIIILGQNLLLSYGYALSAGATEAPLVVDVASGGESSEERDEEDA